jgi:hypothetical protein
MNRLSARESDGPRLATTPLSMTWRGRRLLLLLGAQLFCVDAGAVRPPTKPIISKARAVANRVRVALRSTGDADDVRAPELKLLLRQNLTELESQQYKAAALLPDSVLEQLDKRTQATAQAAVRRIEDERRDLVSEATKLRKDPNLSKIDRLIRRTQAYFSRFVTLKDELNDGDHKPADIVRLLATESRTNYSGQQLMFTDPVATAILRPYYSSKWATEWTQLEAIGNGSYIMKAGFKAEDFEFFKNAVPAKVLEHDRFHVGLIQGNFRDLIPYIRSRGVGKAELLDDLIRERRHFSNYMLERFRSIRDPKVQYAVVGLWFTAFADRGIPLHPAIFKMEREGSWGDDLDASDNASWMSLAKNRSILDGTLGDTSRLGGQPTATVRKAIPIMKSFVDEYLVAYRGQYHEPTSRY